MFKNHNNQNYFFRFVTLKDCNVAVLIYLSMRKPARAQQGANDVPRCNIYMQFQLDDGEMNTFQNKGRFDRFLETPQSRAGIMTHWVFLFSVYVIIKSPKNDNLRIDLGLS